MTHQLLHRMPVMALVPGDRLVDTRLRRNDGESPEVLDVQADGSQVIVRLDDGTLLGLWAYDLCNVARPVWAQRAA